MSGDIITIRHTGISGYDLIGPDGEVFAWASESFTRPPSTVKQPNTSAPDPKPAFTTKTLCGPFTSRPVAPNEYGIISGDGSVSVRVVGRGNADFLVKLLNLAHKHGKA